MVGFGVAKDLTKMKLLAEQAAIQGDGLGQYTLAEIYFWGIGVEADLTKAFDWAEKAAEQNFAKGQAYTGLLLFYNALLFGRPLKKPFTQKENRTGAYYWLVLATRPGLSSKKTVLLRWLSRLLLTKKEAAWVRDKIKAQGISLKPPFVLG